MKRRSTPGWGTSGCVHRSYGSAGTRETKERNQRVRKLCASRPQLYKALGDPLRRRIQLKVLRWVLWYDEGTYSHKVLAKYQVIPYELRTEDQKQPFPPIQEERATAKAKATTPIANIPKEVRILTPEPIISSIMVETNHTNLPSSPTPAVAAVPVPKQPGKLTLLFFTHNVTQPP